VVIFVPIAVMSEQDRQADLGHALTTPASDLDPGIIPAFAAFLVARVAKAQGLAQDLVSAIVAHRTNGRALGASMCSN
jgi:K+-transporting ATPase c subunit